MSLNETSRDSKNSVFQTHSKGSKAQVMAASVLVWGGRFLNSHCLGERFLCQSYSFAHMLSCVGAAIRRVAGIAELNLMLFTVLYPSHFFHHFC